MSTPDLPEGAKPRPAPIPDAESAPFWTGTLDGKLLVQECSVCGRRQLYGRSICTNCHATALTWLESSGKGAIYSRTIIRQNPSRSFKHMIPFVVALVDLDDGPRLMSNVVGTPAEAVPIGARVRVRFEPVSDAAALPLFELDD
ncbi:MAG TPA: Zn-ribbon domain-containing OB-fold protein [Acidimicrobiales bacterium]|nr:Zn-ribbon domain-containing OB-fold protein [Acidimicrobiales bacterium]